MRTKAVARRPDAEVAACCWLSSQCPRSASSLCWSRSTSAVVGVRVELKRRRRRRRPSGRRRWPPQSTTCVARPGAMTRAGRTGLGQEDSWEEDSWEEDSWPDEEDDQSEPAAPQLTLEDWFELWWPTVTNLGPGATACDERYAHAYIVPALGEVRPGPTRPTDADRLGHRPRRPRDRRPQGTDDPPRRPDPQPLPRRGGGRGPDHQQPGGGPAAPRHRRERDEAPH